MKKIILSVFALLATLSLMATQMAPVEFSVMLQAANGRTSIASARQGSQYTAGQDEGDQFAFITNTTTAVNVYFHTAFGELAQLATNDLNGNFMGFTTNGSTTYTLLFDGLYGGQAYIKDHANNDSIIRVDSTVTYQFTAAAQTTVNDRFELVYLPGPDPTICHRYGQLLVDNYYGQVVVRNNDGAVVLTEDVNGSKAIDLSGLTAGYYKVDFDGKTLIIQVDPTVTPGPAPLTPGGDPSHELDI